MSEPEAEHLPERKIASDTELAIESFVDEMMDLHPNLDREALHDKISGCVQEYVSLEERGEEEEKEEGLIDKAKDKLPGQ